MLIPAFSAFAWAIERVRSVRIELGAIELTVTPSGASSPDSILAIAVTPGRNALERRSRLLGSFTKAEVMLTIRPCFDFLIDGSAFRQSQTALIVVRWKAFSQVSSSTWSRVPGGA